MHNFCSASYLWYVSGSKGLLGLVCFSVLFGKIITLLFATKMLSILMVKVFASYEHQESKTTWLIFSLCI